MGSGLTRRGVFLPIEWIHIEAGGCVWFGVEALLPLKAETRRMSVNKKEELRGNGMLRLVGFSELGQPGWDSAEQLERRFGET